MMDMIQDYSKQKLVELIYLGFTRVTYECCLIDIKCPIWLTVGDNDHTPKVMAYNKRWHEETEKPLRIIKEATRNASDDGTEQVNELIEKFSEERCRRDRLKKRNPFSWR